MIRYTLKCAADHVFESWFQSADACDGLVAKGMVGCPFCGSTDVAKTLMAPALRPARKVGAQADTSPEIAAKTGPEPDSPSAAPLTGPLSTPAPGLETALAALRREVEKNSEYVGMNFVTEARRIHAGNAPERAIHGEAKPDEARRLIEDGVPVTALPFLPSRKAN